jgi:hypothetical protein
VASSFEEIFLEKIRKELDRQAEDLAMGSADDYAAYREKVGLIRGLMVAVNMFEELANKARKENLDD